MNRNERLLVGRDAACDLRFDDDTVSRRHATVQAAGYGRFRLVDLASSNGTWLRREDRWRRVIDDVVEAGDTIRFGEREVVLREALGALLVPGLAPPGGGTVIAAGAEPEDPPLERPRRNPETGEIEESS